MDERKGAWQAERPFTLAGNSANLAVLCAGVGEGGVPSEQNEVMLPPFGNAPEIRSEERRGLPFGLLRGVLGPVRPKRTEILALLERAALASLL